MGWLLVTRVEIERRDSVGKGRTGGTSGKLRNSDVLTESGSVTYLRVEARVGTSVSRGGSEERLIMRKQHKSRTSNTCTFNNKSLMMMIGL